MFSFFVATRLSRTLSGLVNKAMNPLVRDILSARISGALAQAGSFSNVEHHGTRGRLREIVLSQLIEPFLPPTWRVTSGLVCSAHGNSYTDIQTGQEDLLIFDPSLLPPFFAESEQTLLPIESVLAVVEVKSRLTATGVGTSVAHAKRVRNTHTCLKFGKYSNPALATHLDWLRWPSYHVFAFDSDLQGKTKTEWKRLRDKHIAEDLDAPIIDSVCVAGRCAYVNDANKQDFKTLVASSSADGKHTEVINWLSSLIDFARLMHLARIQMNVPTFSPYVQDLPPPRSAG